MGIGLNKQIWAWAHRKDSLFNAHGIKIHSKTTPSRGAELFHAGRIFMALSPSEAEAEAVAGFGRVVWRIHAKDNFDFSQDLNSVRALAGTQANINGVVVDDLTSTEIGKRGMKTADLARLREQVHGGDKPLDLWGVIYSMNLGIPSLGDYLRELDGVTFWVWEARDIASLEDDFKKAEKLVRDKPILLGIYTYDFGGEKPMPMDMMRHQCALAEKWLEEGRITGVVMHCTCIADFPQPAVQYAYEWTGLLGQSPA
ncbi:MAG: hypothetical protein WC299_01950 [Kiritimatiellia bacterium]